MGFGNGARVEVEGNYRTNHLRSAYPVSGSNSSAQEAYGVMFNALYDFDLRNTGWDVAGMMPYLGLGVGWVHTNWDKVTIASGNGRVRINSGDDNFGVQGIVGVAFPVQAVPGLAVTAEYRLIDEPTNRDYRSLYQVNGASYSSTTRVSSDINQSLLIGLRLALNTPQPAAAATAVPAMQTVNAVQPAPARSYLLFFDWDRADLSTRALQIIADAARNSTQMKYTKLDVSGHADLSGTHAYNQGLSLRRANAVAQQLVKNGVPENAIVITALGDTKPLVPTAPGVREPQNRRVEIVIN
jgi:outer membrane protein OmpA-like peptidoglycan-associated protein